ncbi:MAG: type II secretion system F family protein [Alphaproteobacteria bacterium]
MSIVDRFFDPQFLGALLAGLAVFATVLTLAAPLLKGDRLAGRLKAVSEHRDALRRRQMEELNKKANIRGQQVDFMKRAVDQLKLQNLLETPGIREKLSAAGYRGQGPVYAFLFFRFAMPLLLMAGAAVYFFVLAKGEMPMLNKIVFTLGAGAAGFYVPDLYLKNVTAKRQESIMRAFPDALDLLLICVESGMSIEAAFNRVAGEVGSQSVELAEEFSLLTAELSYLPDRRQAYDNLAKRCAHPGVKAVCTALNQAEKYGTPLASALRVMALENRELRMQAAEEKAASLPAKLTVPMILFFLPPLFVVILGPAVMKVSAM